MTQKAHYINKTSCNPFTKNRAIIRDVRNGITTCYLINTQGEFIKQFAPNLWCDRIEDDNVIFVQNENLSKEALFDFIGNQLTDFKYKAIFGGVEEGFFEVRDINNKHGQLSLNGQEVIPCIYEDSHYFHEGIAPMKLKGKWGALDWNNNTVIPFEYEDIQVCCNNKIAVLKNGKWGLTDKFNNILIDFKFDDICFYINRACGSFPVKIGDKWGISDIYGDTLYDFIFEDCDGLNKVGWFKFSKNSKWAIYSCEQNKFISDFIYDKIDIFSNGICKVYIGGQVDYVDTYNNSISDFAYDDVKHFYNTNLVAIYKNGKCGVMNSGGKVLIPPKYDEHIRYASENTFVMEDDNYNQYVIDINENILIQKKEHQHFCGGYSCGYIISQLDGYLDKQGKNLELKFNRGKHRR